MTCKNCGSSNIESDKTRGDTFCIDCGCVLEENMVVNDVAFEESKVVGTFVNNNATTNFIRTKNGYSMIDAFELRMRKAEKLIQLVASKLSMQHFLVEMAKRFYKLASQKKFIQGRKTRNVIGAILYTVCRIQKTGHLLIDFSDVLQVNLYVLGSIYLKLVKILQLNIPIIDPSLYIHRYCAKLEFGEKVKIVEQTSIKIIQCMKRDWITEGRRPAGLCGASILIAARLHGFNRTINQIINVVNVCDETIKIRLREFAKTDIVNLTKEEFESFNIEFYYKDDENSKLPPSFQKNRVKDKLDILGLKNPYTYEYKEKAKEIQNILEAQSADKRLRRTLRNKLSNRRLASVKIIQGEINKNAVKKEFNKKKDIETIEGNKEEEQEDCENEKNQNQQIQKKEVLLELGVINKEENMENNLKRSTRKASTDSNRFRRMENNEDAFLLSKPQDIQLNLFLKAKKEMEFKSTRKESGNFNPFKNTENFNISEIKEIEENTKSPIKKDVVEKEEELDDLDENETKYFIVTEEEYKLKKILWEVIFKEWIDEQKNKETIEIMTHKKRVRKSSKAESTIATNPIEAIKNSTKFQKNINMGVIENLFSPKAIL